MKNSIIQVAHATKKFKDTTALNSINISFEENHIHGIIGRNGSGKTVLLKCICGLMHLDSGTITVRDKVVGTDMDIPPRVGAIIEAPGFLPNYSGLQNLKFLAGINRTIKTDEIKNSLKCVGLDPDMKKHVGKYSLGMRQRLGLAQAIMEKPDILILDEPMNGLDNEGVLEIRKLLLNLKASGVTILLASHSKEDISVLCDTVIEMDKGEVITTQCGETAVVQTASDEAYIAAVANVVTKDLME